MKAPEDLRGMLTLYTAYYDDAKSNAMNSRDVEDAARWLRKMYDWRIRLETLTYVLNDGDTPAVDYIAKLAAQDVMEAVDVGACRHSSSPAVEVIAAVIAARMRSTEP